MIEVTKLTKTYRVPVKDPGFWGSVKSLYDRRYKDVVAVSDVSFTVEKGERVGFLGPNGAGKTTTLKMLTGLLHPTSGSCKVLGYVPAERHDAYLKKITLVMGQKQQMMWDLPPQETFLLNGALYDMPRKLYDESLGELTELLSLAEFANQPVRNLSLGQRMRAELAAALLHRPEVLFLDEPTIGLDVEVQATVRKFIAEYNRRHGATVMLTSHDMDDVAALAQRVILIDQGLVRFDGSLSALKERFGGGRKVVLRQGDDSLVNLGFEKKEAGSWEVTVKAADVNGIIAEVLRRMPQAELTVADPPLEEVLTQAFGEGRKAKAEEAAP